MSLIKFNRNGFPWINDQISNWLNTDNFFSDDFFVKERNLPAMNIKDNKSGYEIELAVPGFSKDDIEVTIEDDILNVSAQTSKEDVEETDKYTRKEFNYNSFERKLQLPNSVDQTKKIEAVYKDGILTLNLGKKKEAIEPKKQKIEIA